MADAPSQTEFEVVFETEGRPAGRMRNEVTGRWVGGDEGRWEMATDESAFHGGENTVPPLLAYWATGFTYCFIEQTMAVANSVGHCLKIGDECAN